MITGSPVFNGLAAAEGNFSFLSTTVQLKIKAAFVDPKTGKTHGWTETAGGWSKETMVALENLRTSIEKDLARVHFGSEESGETSNGVATSGPIGLGESLSRDAGEVPQV